MSRDLGAGRGLGRGSAAPDFCLPDAARASRCLHDFLADGPVLLWFYRGHW